MKKIGLYSFLLVLSLFSCKKILDKLLTFTFKDEAKITLPAAPIVDTPLTLATPEVTSNASSEFESNGSSLDHVKTVKLSEIKLDITSPTNQTFNFLNSIEISISASGLDDVLIAQKTNIPNDNLTSLTLETTDANFAEHIKKEKYKLNITTVTDEVTTNKVEITSFMTYKVTASALKN